MRGKDKDLVENWPRAKAVGLGGEVPETQLAVDIRDMSVRGNDSQAK